MFRRSLSLFLLALLVSGCEILSPENDPHEPGALRLEYSLNRDNGSDIFDLGEISNTQTYDFNLMNSGESDLFDISVTSPNNQLFIEPSLIRVLSPIENTALYPNLRITVVHGTSASSVGPAETLAMGENELNLVVAAKTLTHDGDTISVNLQSVLRLTARLVDVGIFDSQGAIDLLVSRNPLAAAWHSKWYDVVEGPIRLVNTGNVQLQVQILKQDDSRAPAVYEETNVMLDPLEEISIDRIEERIFFRIDGDNTISDFEKLPIQQDGFIYIACTR